MRNLFLFLPLLWVVFQPLGVNAQQFTFRNIGIEDGLPASTINRIIQGPNGVIWIATEGGGMVSYNGNTIRKYDTEDGLPSNFVSDISLVGDLFWIGTEKGVCIFDGKEIMRFDTISGAPASRVYDALEFEGRVYLATASGLIVFENQTFHSTEIEIPAYSLAQWNGELLCGTQNGLYRGSVQWMAEGREVRTISTRDGELRFSAGNEVLDQNEKVLWSGLGTIRDLNGSFVASLNRGLIEVGDGGEYREYENQNGLEVKGFRCLFRDDHGVLWIGGFQGIHQYLEPGIGRFTRNHGLNDERIWSIGVLKENLLLGSMGQLMSVQVPTIGISPPRIDELPYLSGNLPEGIIFEILVDEKDSDILWLGTEKGLVRVSPNSTKLYRGPVDLANDFFVFDLEFFNGELIVASSNGLYQFERGSFKEVISREDSPFGGFFSLVVYQDRILALSPSGEGYIYDGGKVTKFEGNIIMDSLNPSSAEVVDENLLVGTYGGGIFEFDGKTFHPFPSRDGHLNENILSLQYNGFQTLYAATDKGIRIWEREPSGKWRSVRLLGEREGIPVGKINPQAVGYHSMGDLGMIWWGSSEGVFYLDERKFLSGPVNPGARIGRVELNLKPGQWEEAGWPFGGWEPGPRDPKLAHDQNYLRFEFFSPSEVYGREVQFRYRLKGLGDEWTAAGDRHEAVFTSLPNGDFEFQLEARWPDHSGFWYPAKPFSFKVIPPFWQTWWFIAFAIITVGLLIYTGVRYRINQINRSVAMQNRLAELEGQALRLQMNPHFIFNALESINGFIFRNDQKQATQYLNQFAKLMRLTLESSREHKIVLQTEIQILNNYLSLEQLRFSGSFTFEVKVKDDLDPYSVLLPPMLIQPLVENAILHGLRPLESGGDLKITFANKGEELQVIVEDNGIGRIKAAEMAERISKHRSMATEITNERLQLLRKKENGEFRLDIQDLYDKEGRPSGTRVILSLPFELEDF